MTTTAFLFPGQGSQAVGMGHDIFEEFDYVRELFDMAEEICKLNLRKLCFEGPLEALTETVHLQPAVTTVNLAFLRILSKNEFGAQFFAGHSLGEFSALCAAGTISEEDTLRLVNQRGQLMHRESQKYKGAMSAILKLTIETVEEVVRVATETGPVSVANHNTAQQIVITGAPPAVTRAAQLAQEAGGRAIGLNVSGAWHSELIRGAEAEFIEALQSVPFAPPQNPVIHNVSAETAQTPDDMRTAMGQQLCSPVKWFESMQNLLAAGTAHFVEVGPGKVLTGMMKKIVGRDFSGVCSNINDMASLEAYIETAG